MDINHLVIRMVAHTAGVNLPQRRAAESHGYYFEDALDFLKRHYV